MTTLSITENHDGFGLELAGHEVVKNDVPVRYATRAEAESHARAIEAQMTLFGGAIVHVSTAKIRQ